MKDVGSQHKPGDKALLPEVFVGAVGVSVSVGVGDSIVKDGRV